MPRWLIAVVVLAAVAAALLWYLRGRSRKRTGAGPGSAAVSAPASPAGPGGDAPPGELAAARRAEARARRDALRDQIVRRLAALPPPPAAPGPSASPSPTVRPPGNLQDRVGGREALVQHLNHDFMPLADECIEAAQARVPDLHGMLALSIEAVADEELGAVVDVAEAAPSNQVPDPELLECIRESALSLVFPPPLVSGREKFQLTMPIDRADAGP